jgi:hypothetical protein
VAESNRLSAALLAIAETLATTMKKILPILTFGILIGILSCKNVTKGNENGNPESTFIERIEKLSDSIKVDDIVIKNLFKSQILAHRGANFDSLMIIEKVYRPHQELWDNCYAMIFGEENSSKFNTTKGMVEWNKTLYPENKDFFQQRANELLDINIDSALNANLARFKKLVPHSPKAKISILFTPFQGIGFGGCSGQEFCFELNNKDYDVAYTIEKGIPHELNHLANEPLISNDPSSGTALFLTIDEGFACYFTWAFFDGNITKWEAVENMTENDWDWYLQREKDIFKSLKPYFDDKSGDNPLLRNDTHKLYPDAPKTLYYWLGFRIIESYVKQHGQDSWKELYGIDAKEVLEKSGYEDYINDNEK